MTKIFKSKYTKWVFIAGILGSLILIIVNYTQIDNYRIKLRNEERKLELQTLSEGLKKYILEKNTCPSISTPAPQTFLPELIIDSNNSPKGGANINNIEEVESYLNRTNSDPSGAPYFIGISNNLIYIYTNDYEINSNSRNIYFVTIEASLCNQIRQ